MNRDTCTINGVEVNLVNNGSDAVWKSDRPIRCPRCRAHRPLLQQFRFSDADIVVCVSRGAACFGWLVSQLGFYDEDPRVRAIVCPENTPETRKGERQLLSYKLRWEVLKRDGFKCVACGGNDRLEIDHIVPISRGGRTEMSNLQTLCFPCNRGKSDG